MTMLVDQKTGTKFIVRDIIKGEMLYRVDAHADMLTSIAFSPDGSKIATGSADKMSKLWDAAEGINLLQGPMAGHLNAFSPDCLHLVSASLDGTIRVWDASTGASIFGTDTIDGLEKVVFSADGQSLIYASAGGVINRWPFPATLLAGSSSSNADAKKMSLSESKVCVKFPRSTDIMATYITSKQFIAAIRVTNQLITVDLV